MAMVTPFVREAGAGPTVVCLHSNAASSAQWRGLMDRLAPGHRVLAPDSFGSGKSPDWPSDRVITLADEAALIEPVLQSAAPLALVGHSHGGAVALKAALLQPARIRALVLYEPTLFALIEQAAPAPNAADGIREAVARASSALDAGDRDLAAQAFIDYWMGEGSWARTPPERRGSIAASVVNVRRWWHALATEPTPLAALAALDMPVLLMLGERSTAAAHGVAEQLTRVLPNLERVVLPGLGHMGPVTHPDAVNPVIESFLKRHHPHTPA